MFIQKVINVKYMYTIYTKQNKDTKDSNSQCTLGVKSVGKGSGWEYICIITCIEY